MDGMKGNQYSPLHYAPQLTSELKYFEQFLTTVSPISLLACVIAAAISPEAFRNTTHVRKDCYQQNHSILPI
tara:strand:- start:637 stop:852 length:216 start_codon:yes stop_codon:yes gene_type:complete